MGVNMAKLILNDNFLKGGGCKMARTKDKTNKNKFQCSICLLTFEGVPYAHVSLRNKEKLICNCGCWKTFVEDQEDSNLNDIEDNVLMTKEAIEFQAALERRADFAQILDILKEEVEGIRIRWGANN